MAALCDLAEICQAAVLNDSLAVSPGDYHGSTLLQQLDFVEDPTPKVKEIPPDQDLSIETSSSQDDILIDVDEAGELTSDHPVGRLYLTHLAAELLQGSPILGPLANPKQIPIEEDRGLYFLDKLPAFIFLLQTKKGAAAFESDDIRRDLLERTKPDLTAYAKFERWTIPPLGIMVLGQANSLDDLPKEIAKLRDKFLKVRRELIELEEAKQAALLAGSGLDDRQYKEVVRIDQRIKKAFEAFDASLADYRRSNEIKRSEVVFNMPKYLSWLTSIGIGSLNDLIELANLKRINYLTYIPGLYKTVSFIKRCDDKYIVDIAERLLGRPFESFSLHAHMLQFAAGKVETYSVFKDNAAPIDEDILTIGTGSDKIEIPHSQLWALMVKDSSLKQLLLHPLRR